MNFEFCDLCINHSGDFEELKKILDRSYEVGYRTVAVNQIVDEAVLNNDKKKKRKVDPGEETIVPAIEPLKIDDLIKLYEGKLTILRRLSFKFNDPSKIHFLNQLNILKDYDIFSVIPKSHNAFQYTCGNVSADIITIRSESSGIKLSRKLYFQAVERGIRFEIQYSDVINSKTRINAIHHSHLFFTFGKSKNVLISSGASNSRQVRDPYDVINLGRLLGLNEEKSKSSILKESHRAILKGAGRVLGKSIFVIKSDVSQHENEDKMDLEE